MKRTISLTLSVLMTAALLAGCGTKTAPEKTPEELTALYAEAITANGGEMVEYNPVVTAVSEEDGSAMILELLGLNPEDMTAFGVSASMMNTKAYGIALVRPAAEKEDAVREGLQGFIDRQKQSFERYLEDQYEVAKNARLETLEDGTILMVMTQEQDTVFNSIKEAVEKA